MYKRVEAVHLSETHSMKKYTKDSISLIRGLGVEGDAHFGKKVKHRYLIRKDPTKANLRQVHLIQNEIFDELKEKGFEISPGEMGENITTSGIDILNLPEGTILELGKEATIQITGLRTPCVLLDGIQKGLMKALISKKPKGEKVFKAGVMAIVLKSGKVKKGDGINVIYPPKPFIKMKHL